ncbi:hypothetical protein [Alkalinema sp. FACHB-956]|nr:hypothetical protein [Alkalinema sp. FACHB-956]MBD2326096.1 hypothetical protein [Alkalinema sp. FACHB-956]
MVYIPVKIPRIEPASESNHSLRPSQSYKKLVLHPAIAQAGNAPST